MFRLRDLATAGGSGVPFLVEDANATQGLNDALMNITRDPLPCEYQIPTPSNPLEGISYDRIQVVHTPTSGAAEEVPYATTRGGCSSLVWRLVLRCPAERGHAVADHHVPLHLLELRRGHRRHLRRLPSADHRPELSRMRLGPQSPLRSSMGRFQWHRKTFISSN